MQRKQRIFVSGALISFFTMALPGLATTLVQVTVQNHAPSGGVYITPVWIGFHNGSFDSYDVGSAAETELERLAEDGNVGPLMNVFGADGTLVPTGVNQVGTRVQGVLGGGPLGPGASASQIFDIDAMGANQFLSYASMVLPTNDYFVANGNPMAWDISALHNAVPGMTISFDIGLTNMVYDAGTEVNDFATSAGNGLFPGLGGGQSGPNEGTDEGGVVNSIVGPAFDGFLNAPGGFDFGPLNFNNASLYTDGIATIAISVVPEPSTMALLSIAAVGFIRRRISSY